MKSQKIRSFFLLWTFLISNWGQTAFNIKDSDIVEYKKILNDFTSKLCSKKTNFNYNELLKEYRGEGYYIPTYNEIVLDTNSIRLRLPLIRGKLSWQKSQIHDLRNKLLKFPRYKELVTDLQRDIKNLLVLKRIYTRADSSFKKRSIEKKSQILFNHLRNHFKQTLDKIPFLLSYDFPVDHFKLRRHYDEIKASENIELKKRSNQLFLKRKILEDGTYNDRNQGSDLFLRSLIDTLFLRIQKDHTILPEDIRYDMNAFFSYLRAALKRGKRLTLKRFINWNQRTSKQYRFYQRIISEAEGNPIQQQNSREMLIKKKNAKSNLEDFTLSKQAQSYEFWAGKEQKMQALFALDTILMNEVGGIDGVDALERKDVAQVVYNRRLIPFYSSIPKDNGIYMKIKSLGIENKISHSPWLNVLFKEGEFSFTYYFIPSTTNIYCPDVSNWANAIRDRSLEVAQLVLNNPQFSFQAVRYFSRASMLGRIDMSVVWSDHEAIAERPGVELAVKQLNEVNHKIKKHNYTYFYSFEDPTGTNYDVLEVDEKIYVRGQNGQGKKSLFKFRNPHFFRFFKGLNHLLDGHQKIKTS